MFVKLKKIFFIVGFIVVTIAILCGVSRAHVVQTLLPTCDSRVYCQGELLEKVQLAELYKDSKTFVDMRMKNSEEDTLDKFDQLMFATDHNPSKEDLRIFVDNNFLNGDELENGTLTDWNANLTFLEHVSDLAFKEFAHTLNNIWPILARKVRSDVAENYKQYSIEPIPHTFIIPGGRFREPYYWDSYWIISGLLVCNMTTTARHMIENFFWFVDKYGFVPNGGRVYYSRRSQPPLLTYMVSIYMNYTDNKVWLKQHIDQIENELNFWLKERSIYVGNNRVLHYYADVSGPRPESYREDIATGKGNQEIYIELKSAAESGWDFSSRWFSSHSIFEEKVNDQYDLTHVRTSEVAPADLNGFYCGATKLLANFYDMVGNAGKAKKWRDIFDEFRQTIYKLLWDEDSGIWYDLNVVTGKKNKQFYPSNFAPLWADCLADEQKKSDIGQRAVDYLKKLKILENYRGGIPSSLKHTGEQWDMPNAWPPLQSIVIYALQWSGNENAQDLAFKLAQQWINANLIGYTDTNDMFEKYDAETPGHYGGGGEYEVQSGFGWTNGVIFEILNTYGEKLKFTKPTKS